MKYWVLPGAYKKNKTTYLIYKNCEIFSVFFCKNNQRTIYSKAKKAKNMDLLFVLLKFFTKKA